MNRCSGITFELRINEVIAEIIEKIDGQILATWQLEKEDVEKSINALQNWEKLKNDVIDLFNKSQDMVYLDILERMQNLEKN